MIWLATGIVVVVVLALVVPRELRLYRRASRRGGLLELDTPEARAALADPDDWFADSGSSAYPRRGDIE